MKMGMLKAGQRPRLSVVVPIYNEENGLDELLRRVTTVCEKNVGSSYEIVLVNDGSTDASWSIISSKADSASNITGISLARNYGHQMALSAGLQSCRGERVLVLDADLQDPPELLPTMLTKMDEGYDVVYGQRIRRKGETAFKRVTASLFYRILGYLVDVAIPRDTGDFRLMSRRVVDQLNAMPERYRFVRGMVGWIGFRQIALPYERHPRFSGSSHYPLRKMMTFAVDAVTSFSIIPLRFASHLGALFGIFGLFALGWVAISWWGGETIAGWTSLATLILILGSVQLLVLGVFGEYLGRMYIESKSRPLFVIDEIRGGSIAFQETDRADYFGGTAHV